MSTMYTIRTEHGCIGLFAHATTAVLYGIENLDVLDIAWDWEAAPAEYVK